MGWVKNGGTLTHCKKDFYEAQYFFCNGLDDPWLHELSYRCLVVRHASWIAKCISEQFIMPVGAYILDDDFDPVQIEIRVDEETSMISDRTLISTSGDVKAERSPATQSGGVGKYVCVARDGIHVLEDSTAYEAVRLRHALFWKRATRGCGPVVRVKIGDVVETRVDVNARMFVPGDSCYGEEFGCKVETPQ
ncbi:hypothetical protein E4T56_gene1819 [Termitomyces sp. T112]|nr:hypothetical protein E4T56_gene1819 [Termitomyces sp. T112]